MKKTDKYSVYCIFGIIGCTIVNTILSYLVRRSGLPLYLDSAGTILISLLGGAFPGIVTAVATSLLCVLFYPDSMYYSFIGVLIAVFTAWFNNGRLKRMKDIVLLHICISLTGGILGVLFQWMLLGKSQFGYVDYTAKVMSGGNGIIYFLCSLTLIVGLNLVDKGITMLVALFVYRSFSQEIRTGIWNCGWRQAPLSESDIKKIKSVSKGSVRSLRIRVALMMVASVLALTLAFVIIIYGMNPVYMKEYFIKLTLAFSGFFVLILSYGLRISRQYLEFPIGSLEKSIDGFMKGIDDQDTLDESVKNLQKLDIRTNDEVEKLYKSVCEMAIGTAEQMRSIRVLAKTNEKMQNGLIITMADMVESRDSDTGSHIQKTAAYVRIILSGLKRKGYYAEKLTDKYMDDVEMSAPLHDIGKINVSDTILNKPGKLTDEEFEIMKTHTTAGKKILENAISSVEGGSYLKEARNMAAYHHERWDGKGYPEGLHGQVIPLSARVMAVADVFDALASPRVYKPAFPIEKALDIIREGSGTQFDPKCVEVFLDSLDEVHKIVKKYHEE